MPVAITKRAGRRSMSSSGEKDPGQRTDVGAVEIRAMTTKDMDPVCELIGLAFAENPSTLANVRGDRERAHQTMRDAVRIAKFGRPWSHALVAVEAGRIAGVLNAAEWPHCQLGIVEKIRTTPSMVRIMRTALPRAFTMMSKREAADPSRPHWHIGPVGVRPELQGRGIGKALLERFLADVDEREAAAFLETDVDRNVTLYEHFGFAVTMRQEIVGVNTRFMWRDPHTSLSAR
jgi:ribosomal protein S18 acetylase RimI-like enzyme